MVQVPGDLRPSKREEDRHREERTIVALRGVFRTMKGEEGVGKLTSEKAVKKGCLLAKTVSGRIDGMERKRRWVLFFLREDPQRRKRRTNRECLVLVRGKR